jgi:hypothetical protein
MIGAFWWDGSSWTQPYEHYVWDGFDWQLVNELYVWDGTEYKLFWEYVLEEVTTTTTEEEEVTTTTTEEEEEVTTTTTEGTTTTTTAATTTTTTAAPVTGTCYEVSLTGASNFEINWTDITVGETSQIVFSGTTIYLCSLTIPTWSGDPQTNGTITSCGVSCDEFTDCEQSCSEGPGEG